VLQIDESPLYPFLIDRAARQATVLLPVAEPRKFTLGTRANEHGVFVTKVYGGADPAIREGYKVVEVNGENVEMAKLSSILTLLEEDGYLTNTVVLEASRIRYVTIVKEDPTVGFGITLQAYEDKAEQPLRVVDVVPHTPAGRSGEIQSGDSIVAMNGVPTTYAKAIFTLTTATEVTLEVERGRQDPMLVLATSQINVQHHAVFLKDQVYSTIEYIAVGLRGGVLPPSPWTAAADGSLADGASDSDSVVIEAIYVRKQGAELSAVHTLGMLRAGATLVAIDDVYFGPHQLAEAAAMLSSAQLANRSILVVAY